MKEFSNSQIVITNTPQIRSGEEIGALDTRRRDITKIIIENEKKLEIARKRRDKLEQQRQRLLEKSAMIARKGSQKDVLTVNYKLKSVELRLAELNLAFKNASIQDIAWKDERTRLINTIDDRKKAFKRDVH